MTKRWATIVKYTGLERPEIKGLFVDGICVAAYSGYRNVYMVSIYCYMSTVIHRSIMVDTLANCKRIIEENYLKDDQHCKHKNTNIEEA